ncbi:hypothetical protein Rhopal_002436-T1 [Rhodotorula paludigena]|uniref:ATP-dependent RNA helicase n=1 Tax=Rhodotorula paludigena TaxID=86838 RepID=A0AAV5GA83_9BASI|nr:hypothetical protein Rhopal_002436-T1 [Rhodotorula paludigena]
MHFWRDALADELVLNFDTASPNSAPARARTQQRNKGGRWTDRAKERKRGQIEQRRATRPDAHNPQQGGGAPPAAHKRKRDDDPDAGPAGDSRPAKHKGKGPAGAPGPAGKGRLEQAVGPAGKKQFISSLFTAEGLPEPAASTSTSTAPAVPAKPSNAPLTSAPVEDAPAADEHADADEGPDPAPELTKLGLMRELVAGLSGKLGITGPTACQAGAIPRLVPSASASAAQRKGKKRASIAADLDFAHDAILRAQTGSGKTLTFLLPMLQDILSLPPHLLRPASSSSSAPSSSSSAASSANPDRSIGTLALILAPTRELASQIHTVLSSLLSSLPSHASSPSRTFSISPRALTVGLLVGGANRTHEKRRLRKGCPIVVATPGRLLDHLKTTEAFRLAGEAPRSKGPAGRPAGKGANAAPLGQRGAMVAAAGERVGLRWLIVDECDRLMDLGFEEQMKGILEELERRSPSSSASLSAAADLRRRTILCSATASEGVDRLAGMALAQGGKEGEEMPIVGAREDVRVKEPARKDLTAAVAVKRGADADDGEEEGEEEEEEDAATADNKALSLPSGFTPPSQLQHHFIVVPPKLRFVTLVALLRKLLVKAQTGGANGRGAKVLVFMSCTDAVDFWWKALGHMKMGSAADEERDVEDEADDAEKDDKRLVSVHPLLPGTPIYRLHGSLPLQTRLASLGAFSGAYTIEDGKRKGQETDAGVLLCTSVAARGLDVKNVGCVVQVDMPTEGGVTEYVHRVGRTARAGAQGTAYSFLLPIESGYTSYLETGLNAAGERKVRLREVGVEQVLREGYGGEGREYETRATDVQMGFERWVNASEETAALARRAFQAHVRAYATHPSAEKSIFNTKALHLGHLAKSFGMREAPGAALASGGGGGGKKPATKKARMAAAAASTSAGTRVQPSGDGGFETGRRRKTLDAEARMKKLMQGPRANGGGEFQIAGNDMIAAIAKRK